MKKSCLVAVIAVLAAVAGALAAVALYLAQALLAGLVHLP